MRVCYFGTYRENYSRNQIMIAGLRSQGVDVVECHVPLWHGETDRVSVASGGWLSLSFVWRVLKTYTKLVKDYFRIGDYDLLVLGYPGQIDVFLAWMLSRLRGKPLVWDVFMSLYLIASERGLVARHPLSGKILYALEKIAYTLPDRLVQDTQAYVAWFEENFGVDPSRFCLVPTGADDRVFYPVASPLKKEARFRVLYYGTFIPNHGVPYIVEAAKILREESDVHFELIGEGVTKAQCVALAETYNLDNITFTGWVDKAALPGHAAQADVCLGAFGTTPQSLMTIQNKIYEGLAMGKPVISGDSPVVRATLKDGEHILLCRRASPTALAEAVLRLRDDPALCQRLSENGYRLFVSQFSIDSLGARFQQCLSASL